MSNKNRRREQRPKNMGNRPLNDAMRDKRFSNAAGPHKPKTAYVRKPKHRSRYEAE